MTHHATKDVYIAAEMAREKVEVTRRTTANKRQGTFTKRKKGLMKKVRELSILCGVQVVLLAFSPAGKPNLILGENSFLGDILDAYAKTNPKEREKSKREHLKSLDRTCQKQGHEMNMELLTAEGEVKAELYRNQIREVQAQIDEVNYQLSFWINPEQINDIEQIFAMEESLIEILHIVRLQKRQLLDYISSHQGKYASKDSQSADPPGGANKKLADDISSLEKCPSEQQIADYNHSLHEQTSKDHPSPNPTGAATLHPSVMMPHQELVDTNKYYMGQYPQTSYAPDPFASADYFEYPQADMSYNPWEVESEGWEIGSEGFPFGHNNDSTSGFPVGNYHVTTLGIPFGHDHTSSSGHPFGHEHANILGVPFGHECATSSGVPFGYQHASIPGAPFAHEHASTSGSIGEMQDLNLNFLSACEVTPFDNNPLQPQVLSFIEK